MNIKIITAAVLTLLLAFSMPLMAQEDDYIDLNDYNLDLTVEQKNILEEELSAVVDISGEIDLGMIKIILGELEEDQDFEEDYDPDSEEANFGRGLAQRIKEYKANNEDWTGEGLSKMIHNYMENNHPGQGNGNNPGTDNNPGKGNNGSSNGAGNSKNKPGKGN